MFKLASLCVLLTTASISTPTAAATWNFISAGNEQVLYFFDADTVERSGDTVTLWVKTVQISSPDKDGAWATALRWRIDCQARTIQTLAWSDYDNKGDFIRSNNNVSSPKLALPDSTGEAVLETACEPSFPRDLSSERYFKIAENDVFKARDRWVRLLNSKQDTAPK